MKKLIRFFKDEKGAESVEYAMIVAGIVLAIAAAVLLLGGTIVNVFSAITSTLANIIS